jgi:uncharacterized protein YoxC
MTIVEIAVILVAVAFVVLVGYLVPVMIQVRKTVAESEQLLVKMNDALPPLIGEIRAVSHNMSELTKQAKGGVEHAVTLLHAVGEVGESVQHVHDVVKGSSGSMLTNVASVVAGLKAATHVMKERFREKGGHHNGG